MRKAGPLGESSQLSQHNPSKRQSTRPDKHTPAVIEVFPFHSNITINHEHGAWSPLPRYRTNSPLTPVSTSKLPCLQPYQSPAKVACHRKVTVHIKNLVSFEQTSQTYSISSLKESKHLGKTLLYPGSG